MTLRHLRASLLIALCWCAPAGGADAPPASNPPTAPAVVQWQVVPAESTVAFHGSSTLHDFDGKATVSAGGIDLTPGHECGSVTVSATSMNTGNTSRDRTMHADHMQSATYPTIVFTLAHLERTDRGAIAHGTWAMHGVARPVDVPVVLPTAAPKPGEAHLTAAFSLTMTQWNITIPSTMGIIKVKPKIAVTVDLALVPAPPGAAPAPPIAAALPPLADLALVDQRGATHALGAECKGRILLLFTIDARITAKRCDLALDRRLDPAAPVIRIIDGSSYQASEHEALVKRLQQAVTDPNLCFLLDWTGTVRTRLALSTAPIQLIGFSASGTVVGAAEGRLDATVLSTALGWVGRRAEPRFTADELSTAPKSRQ